MSWESEELYLSRKELKQDKKVRRAKDQSRFKQSNINKLSSPCGKIDHQKGLVQSISSQEVVVVDPSSHQSCACTLRGHLKKEQKRIKNLVVVGDYVDYEQLNEEQGVIHKVLPRKSFLSRAGAYAKTKEHIIAANLDLLFITITLKEPQVKWSLIDRFLIAASQGSTKPIILVNKVDLIQSQDEKTQLDDLVNTYSKLGITVVQLSGKFGEGIDTLQSLLKEGVSSFVGPSGTGKSTILSKITGKELRVGELAAKSQKGAHTTTKGEIFFLPEGGMCIDTPGIKSFALWDSPTKELQAYFSEIFTASELCKYPNCCHINEPGCAVKEAVEKGNIHPNRYKSYKNLFISSGKKDLNR